MRELSRGELFDIIVGAAILGCGGGGTIEEGLGLIDRGLREGAVYRLACPDEFDPEALTFTSYGVGPLIVEADDAPRAGVPKPVEYPGVTAARDLEAYVGSRFAAGMTGELGGTSVAESMYIAASLGLPTLDLDAVGRAVPDVQMSLLTIHGVAITPQAVANELGEAVIVTRVADESRSETLIRALARASREFVWVADHPMTIAEARKATIPGALTRCLGIGSALRAAREGGGDVAAEVARSGGGTTVFRGLVSGHEREDVEGFTAGSYTVAGSGGYEGASLRVWYKNENMLSWRDGALHVTAPDLICVLDEDGFPLINPVDVTGTDVTVLGFPADEKWLTPRGLDLLGPGVLGVGAPYRPLGDVVGAAGAGT